MHRGIISYIALCKFKNPFFPYAQGNYEATALSFRIKSMILSEYGKKAKLVQYQDEIQDKITTIVGLSDDHKYVKIFSVSTGELFHIVGVQ